jgi:hypothetical protein
MKSAAKKKNIRPTRRVAREEVPKSSVSGTYWGEGLTYEDVVAAYFLAALLREEAALALPGIVTRAAVQQHRQGELVIVDSAAGSDQNRLSLQVKRSGPSAQATPTSKISSRRLLRLLQILHSGLVAIARLKVSQRYSRCRAQLCSMDGLSSNTNESPWQQIYRWPCQSSNTHVLSIRSRRKVLDVEIAQS